MIPRLYTIIYELLSCLEKTALVCVRLKNETDELKALIVITGLNGKAGLQQGKFIFEVKRYAYEAKFFLQLRNKILSDA